MDINISQKSPYTIRNNATPQQTGFWAKLKEQNGWNALGFHIEILSDGKIQSSADMLVLVTYIASDLTMAYVPYIPFSEVHTIHTGNILEELTETIHPYLPDNVLFFRYDVPWESPWTQDHDRYDNSGNWLGNPEPHIRELRMNFGTQNHALRKAVSDALPTNTIFIDLNKSTQELIYNMKSKTRYNIRLSQKKGVDVRIAERTELDKWYEIYAETTQRNHIHADDYKFFDHAIEAQNSDKETDLYMLIAEKNKTPLAGMFLTIVNEQATYLYGASSSRNRNLMGTYQLQWEAMQLAKQCGCTRYDMFGVSPSPDTSHPMYGLYRFKSGFGGHLFHRQGCWDYVFDEAKYNIYRATEAQSVGYHN
ncbi:MAG: peptidoglycan bridge formation glycyltransferase FemA/FemB family protein [Salinivirgaceae bacterium]|jgi:lipid II:glycine glycyltransferase (peptidoglycan interpeptide bridge formation enzyme)|nr:peptidoglycan bridge formation glycyltransferase FemA/FemB family protein [Salinivirgaceae bacterium]